MIRGELGEVGRALRRQAAHARSAAGRRGARVRGRGLHRRRGRHGDPVARRLAQARARDQGSVGDPAARGRRRPGGRARLDQGVVALFSNLGSCYVLRVNDVPASTGYGEPVQKLFNFRDGERIVAACCCRARPSRRRARWPGRGLRKRGFGLRFDLEPHREVSTRAGRRFAKPAEGDEIVGVLPVARPNDVLSRGHRRRAARWSARPTSCPSWRTRARRHRDQARRRRRGAGVRGWTPSGQGAAGRRDRERQAHPSRARSLPGHRARRQGPALGRKTTDRARDHARASWRRRPPLPN